MVYCRSLALVLGSACSAVSVLVLSGAIPAAAMAIAVDALLGWVGGKLAPAHLRREARRVTA